MITKILFLIIVHLRLPGSLCAVLYFVELMFNLLMYHVALNLNR